MADWRVRRLRTVTEAELMGLADVLVDCVEGGASVSFMPPFDLDRSLSYWRSISTDVAAGSRALLVAEDSSGVLGTVQLVFGQPENQPHRADVGKLLVHRRTRGRGIGEALMRALEPMAAECGKTVLVLDTADPAAERLYTRLGWQRVGVIPDFALMPDGGLCSTTIFFKRLAGG